MVLLWMEKSTGTLHVLELSIDSDVNWVEHECSNRRLNLEGVFLVRAFHGTHTAKEVFGEVLEAASFLKRRASTRDFIVPTLEAPLSSIPTLQRTQVVASSLF